jgi:hypothetical protein
MHRADYPRGVPSTTHRTEASGPRSGYPGRTSPGVPTRRPAGNDPLDAVGWDTEVTGVLEGHVSLRGH